MAASSTLYVCILTYLQVNFVFNANGLTLPLQTVTTKCESFIKKPQNINQERIINDKLPCDSLTSGLTCSPLLPLDACARSSVNSMGSYPNSKFQENVHPIPTVPKDILINSNIFPDALLNMRSSVPLSDCGINPLISNSISSGLKLPLAVSSTITSLPPPYLKSSECLNHCNKVTSAMSSLAKLSQSPIKSNLAPCNSNPYDIGLHSPLSILNTANYDNQNINLNPISPSASIVFDMIHPQNSNLLGQPEIPRSIPSSSVKSQINSNNSKVLDSYNSATENPISKSRTVCLNNIDQNGNTKSIPSIESSCHFENNLRNILARVSQLGLNNPLISPDCTTGTSSYTSSVPQVTPPCPINSVNQPNTISNIGSLVPQKFETISPLSPCSQSNYLPSSVTYSNTPIPQSTESTLMPDSHSFSSIQMSNPQGCPNLAQSKLFDSFCKQKESNYFIANGDPASNDISSLPGNPKSPIHKYFKNVRTATAKLNDFISSFSGKIASKKIPTLKSFAATSQILSSQSNCIPLQETFEPSLCPPTQFQHNLIPLEDPNLSKMPTTQSCTDNYALAASHYVPVTFRAPIVPKTIVSAFNFPICSTPVPCHNIQDNLVSISSSNYSPNPFTSIINTIPSNPFKNFGSCNKIPDMPLVPPVLPAMYPINPKPLSSILERPTFCSNLFNPNLNTCEDISSHLSEASCSCDSSYIQSFPSSSTISANMSLSCEQITDSCVDSLSSSVFSSPLASFLTSESTLDESQLDLCCRNLENIIAILESSMNFNGELACDFDVPDIISSL